jgi:hypothetical protein
MIHDEPWTQRHIYGQTNTTEIDAIPALRERRTKSPGLAPLAVGQEMGVNHTAQLLVAPHNQRRQAGQARGRAHVRRQEAPKVLVGEEVKSLKSVQLGKGGRERACTNTPTAKRQPGSSSQYEQS